MKIALIGTGNTATVLGRKILSADHEIEQVLGRNEERSRLLATTLQTNYTSNTRQLTSKADLYIIAVSDAAIAEIALQIQIGNKLVVHTAGSVPISVLQAASKNYGSLYPIQSLRSEMKYLPEIAFLVDGNTSEDITLIYDFAQTISRQVSVANDQERMRVHLAAVLVSNFTNHLYALTENYCNKEKTDFALLLPLIHEITNRLSQYPPGQMQTGPAWRQDEITIQTHLSMLENYPEIKNLYAVFTKSIQEFHAK